MLQNFVLFSLAIEYVHSQEYGHNYEAGSFRWSTPNVVAVAVHPPPIPAVLPSSLRAEASRNGEMSTTDSSTATGGSRRWLRILRPFAWWVVLVLGLYGIRTHQRLIEQTRISFTVDLEGKPVGYEATASLDGRPLTSGERVSLGSHIFAVSHPKAESISTNLFVWYGERNLGAITLKRTRGTLVLEVKPPAARLSLVGAEWSLILNNSAGVTSSVPTDVYQVQAQWANHEEKERVTVATGQTGLLRLAPPLGTLTLESDPSGATVIGGSGRTLGTTPLTLPELSPGVWKVEIRLDGYIPVPLSAAVMGNQTNSVRTNLVNWQYSQAMQTARQSLAGGDADRTMEALAAALKAKPNDPDATALQQEAATLQRDAAVRQQQATIAKRLGQAKAMMEKGDYASARSETEAVLKLEADNGQALALQKEMASREEDKRKRAEQEAEAQRQERSEQPKKVYEAIVAKVPDANLFENHELKTSRSARDVEAGILNALRNVQPVFQITRDTWPQPGTFEIQANQELTTALKTSAGGRKCVIVGGQTKDDETRIYFKVLEYKSEAVNKLSLGALIGAPAEVNYVPIHASRISPMTDKLKAQLQEGISNVTARIQGAIGQIP